MSTLTQYPSKIDRLFDRRTRRVVLRGLIVVLLGFSVSGCLVTGAIWEWAENRGNSKVLGVVDRDGGDKGLLIETHLNGRHTYTVAWIPRDWEKFPLRRPPYGRPSPEYPTPDAAKISFVQGVEVATSTGRVPNPMAIVPRITAQPISIWEKNQLKSVGKILRMRESHLRWPNTKRLSAIDSPIFGVVRRMGNKYRGPGTGTPTHVDAIYGYHRGRKEWVLLGSFHAYQDRGHMGRKCVAAICTPVTAAVDIVISPIYILLFIGMGSVPGIP